jgi:hypothetical protein
MDDLGGNVGAMNPTSTSTSVTRVNLDLVTLITMMLLVSVLTFLCTFLVKYCVDKITAAKSGRYPSAQVLVTYS